VPIVDLVSLMCRGGLSRRHLLRHVASRRGAQGGRYQPHHQLGWRARTSLGWPAATYRWFLETIAGEPPRAVA
jgi:hypothetical protein